MRVWHLTLSTFSGIVGGATHYWATLHDPDGERHRVTRVLTAEEIGDPDDEKGPWYCYEAGETTERFNVGADAIQAGVEMFREASQPGDVLLRGLSASMSPQEPIAGPPEVVGVLRRIWERFEFLDGYDGEARYDENVRKVVAKLDDEWWALTHAANTSQ